MAAVPEDEESLLAAGRGSEDLSCGFRKTTRWQGRYHSLLQHPGIGTRLATFMTLAILIIVFATLRMLYVSHP